ncbi:hypothetical protein RSP799_23155, partial [Ralstonia solanacearum]
LPQLIHVEPLPEHTRCAMQRTVSRSDRDHSHAITCSMKARGCFPRWDLRVCVSICALILGDKN